MFRVRHLFLTTIALAVCFKSGSSEPVQSALLSDSFNSTLHFDEIETSDGLGNLTRPYGHLVFYGFHPFLPSDPALRDHVSSADHNCATSPPNALLGTPLPVLGLDSEDIVRPLIITNSTSLSSVGLSSLFTLKGMMIKPMDNLNHGIPPAWTLHIWGYRADGDIFKWSIDFPYDFREMLLVRPEDFTGRRWDMLKHVEIFVGWKVDYGEYIWQFCMDDLEVEFSRAD